MKAVFLALLLVTLARPAVGQGAGGDRSAPADCPASLSLARLAAQSDLILIATPEVPSAQLQTEFAKQEDRHPVDAPLRNATVLKGDQQRDLMLRIDAEEVDYLPSPRTLMSHTGLPSLFFLSRSDEQGGRLFFTSRDALQEPAPEQVAAVRSEVERQRRILAGWTVDRTLPHFARVRRLIAQLPRASEDGQRRIFRELEALGDSAAPAIIAQMDTRTPLRFNEMTLVNLSPDAFEGLRHYGPELIVDALDAILNQLTGYSGDIFNGGSERERRGAVEMWRIYAYDRRCGQR